MNRDRRWKVITPRWPKSADGQWYWKTDTSSDELGVLQQRGARFVPLVEERRIQIADVTADNVFHSSIVKALAYQVMTLTPERKFEPEKTVSGEEAIRVLDIIKDLAK